MRFSAACGTAADRQAVVTWPHSVDDIGGFLITWLPIIFFGIIIWLLLRTMALVPKVKPAMVERDTTDAVGWDDVAGADEAKEELKEVVEFLRDRKKFERLGARVPKGVLLYGPPGTGKTLLAKAAANESGANFYSSSASAFVEMFAGLGAARIRKLFEEARKNAPAIIFIDELDAVGTARSGGAHNREHDQTLNQLLVEMDGFGGADEVVIMGASNRLQDLDPALLRPGRFDRQVNVAPPDLHGREEILRVHTRSKPLGADVDISVLARRTAGLTGADLANIANEAAIFAARHDQQYIRQEDFEGAMERVLTGLQKRRVVTEKEKRILAYHEGGHALVAYLMGDVMPVQKVTIVGRGDALGLAYYLPVEDRYLHTKEELIDVMKVALAGRAAEEIVFGRVTNGAASDLEKVTADRPLDGLRVRHVRRRSVADDAGGQLRALRGDEAHARQRAGPAHRSRLRGGAPPARQASRLARPARRCAAREGDDRPGRVPRDDGRPPARVPLRRDGRHRARARGRLRMLRLKSVSQHPQPCLLPASRDPEAGNLRFPVTPPSSNPTASRPHRFDPPRPVAPGK